MTQFQEFPATLVPEKKSEGWTVAGPCRPYALDGYSVWMKREAPEPGVPRGRDGKPNKRGE